ncbi:hypothetical protein RRG08_049233 [Elysia crispata]|uniref:Uncharacterized protein n=1 Tax=Elysia crispata TaxID=231223 RepID=A0AAE0YTK1_9GAST|nr:hypothetical protein RRG08_049233 [Elysia crispata]
MKEGFAQPMESQHVLDSLLSKPLALALLLIGHDSGPNQSGENTAYWANAEATLRNHPSQFGESQNTELVSYHQDE